MNEAQREAARQRTRAWYRVPGNKERQIAAKAALKAADPEAWRTQKQVSSIRYTSKNRDSINAAKSALTKTLRAQAIEAYGARCNCPGCHVVRAELLCIDHVHGGGAEHRRRLGRSTHTFYRWLRKAGYPSEFQLLCGSCNMAKATAVACPLAGTTH